MVGDVSNDRRLRKRKTTCRVVSVPRLREQPRQPSQASCLTSDPSCAKTHTVFAAFMLLTVSKRLEFSASRRLHVAGWTEKENATAFGPETNARYGSGRNYIAYFVFTGPVDPATGMLINISEIKERVGKVLRDRFDHKFLNEDNPSFRDVPPTSGNVVRQLYCDVESLFSDAGAKLCVCHLSESPERSATYYFTGACEANYWFEFSAARRTMSPHLTQEENGRLFGLATALHGHNYRCRLTFRVEQLDFKRPLLRYDEIETCIRALRAELDHQYLERRNRTKRTSAND